MSANNIVPLPADYDFGQLDFGNITKYLPDFGSYEDGSGERASTTAALPSTVTYEYDEYEQFDMGQLYTGESLPLPKIVGTLVIVTVVLFMLVCTALQWHAERTRVRRYDARRCKGGGDASPQAAAPDPFGQVHNV